MVKNVRAHFRTSILFFPLKLSYPVFELSAKINTGGISLYDVLPASIQPDEPIDVRMASINETSTLLWLLDRVLPVTRWAVQMISSVPRRLAQVLVVPMALMKEAASRTAFKAIIEYKKAKVDSGEAKGGEKPVVEAPKETGPPRDIAELLDTGVVSDEDTDAMTSGFAPPKRLYRNLYMGGYWKDTPEARRGLAMQKIVNDLQFARATYTYGKEQLKTLDDLLALLQNLGFKAHTYLNVRIADFLDLHTIDGMPPEPPKPAKGDPAAPTPPVTPPKPDLTTLKVTDVVTPVLVIIDSPEPDSPPYVFPCMHSEWHLVFEHPSGRFDLGLRFFHDMSAGARFHPRNAWNLPCWIKNRHLLAKDGWDAVLKVVEQARVYIEGVTAMDLGPNSGYGLVGVCQDSVGVFVFFCRSESWSFSCAPWSHFLLSLCYKILNPTGGLCRIRRLWHRHRPANLRRSPRTQRRRPRPSRNGQPAQVARRRDPHAGSFGQAGENVSAVVWRGQGVGRDEGSVG